MTVPIWPDELTQWMMAPDFSGAPADGRIKQPMELGPALLRRRVSASVAPVSGSLHCDQNQVARLLRFWNEETAGGTLPFMFPDQLFDGAIILTDTGQELLTEADENLLIEGWWLVQFAGDGPPPYRPLRRSTAFVASIQLTVLP
jgi:hypothetical protein